MFEVRNLKKVFKTEDIFSGAKRSVTAVDGVSFSLEKGRILAIVGESGSGKTTIARCAAGLETPDSGDILFCGKPARFKDRETRRKIQYIFQDTLGSLNPRMKVLETVAEPIRFHFGLMAGELYDEALKHLSMVGLSENITSKYPHELSGGQRQRVVIARALSMKPELLIADEPVSSLDVSVQAQVLSLFQELNEKEGISIVFITHDLRIVKSLAHNMLVLHNGKAEEYGPVDEIYAVPKSDYTLKLLSSIPGSPYAVKNIGN
jgi:ABC-type oligopeptide transport system ATPase subunit